MSQSLSKHEMRPNFNHSISYLFLHYANKIAIDYYKEAKNANVYQPYLSSKKQITKYPILSETIDNFSLLQPNWDSYSADAISKEAIKRAHLVLEYLNKDYIFAKFDISVFPMRDGGIQYEFDTKQTAAELEISQSGEMNFIRYDNEGNILKIISLPIYELSELSSLLEETDHA